MFRDEDDAELRTVRLLRTNMSKGPAMCKRVTKSFAQLRETLGPES